MALADVIKDDHIIFHWETSHQPANLLKLVDQICWEVGFPTDEMPYYITGERTEFLYNVSKIQPLLISNTSFFISLILNSTQNSCITGILYFYSSTF